MWQQAINQAQVLNWLRRESAQAGSVVGGLCTAGYMRWPRPGCSTERSATIHWENQDSFAEEFDEVELTKSVFVVDGNRMTTAGGTSSIDLMLKIIADDHGEALAFGRRRSAYLFTTIRTDQDTQRLSVPTRIGVRHPKLSSQVIQMMESNIEEPMSPADPGPATSACPRASWNGCSGAI